MEFRFKDRDFSWNLELLEKEASKSVNSIYWHKVIVDTVTGHSVFTESLEVDRGAIKGVVVGVSKHQTGPRLWGKNKDRTISDKNNHRH